MPQTKVTIAETNIPFVITGMYPSFYTQPYLTGTAGNSYGPYTISLPRAVAVGENVLIVPVGTAWVLAQLNSTTSTTFTFILHCVMSTSLMSSTWSAIYYKSNP